MHESKTARDVSTGMKSYNISSRTENEELQREHNKQWQLVACCKRKETLCLPNRHAEVRLLHRDSCCGYQTVLSRLSIDIIYHFGCV